MKNYIRNVRLHQSFMSAFRRIGKNEFFQKPLLQGMPLPVIVHQLSQSQSAPNNSSLPQNPSSAAIETVSQNNYSQSTINTVLNSYTETVPSNDCDPLPTNGLLSFVSE